MGSGRIFDVAVLVLRVVLGVIFLAHGMQKVFGAFGGGGIEAVAAMTGQLNFMPALFWAWVLSISEAVGGAFLILGILPRISAAAIAVIMLVAILKVHASKGFFMMQGGFEYQMLILAVSIFLMMAGAGRFSIYNKW